jgi:hypothetical protein
LPFCHSTSRRVTPSGAGASDMAVGARLDPRGHFAFSSPRREA